MVKAAGVDAVAWGERGEWSQKTVYGRCVGLLAYHVGHFCNRLSSGHGPMLFKDVRLLPG